MYYNRKKLRLPHNLHYVVENLSDGLGYNKKKTRGMCSMPEITLQLITNFRSYLYAEEKSTVTIEKYSRDVLSFFEWLKKRKVTKETVVDYKNHISQNYAPRSVNSMISSINCFLEFMGWNDCRVKTLKIQKQIFSDKEKELTKEEYNKLLSAALESGNKKLWLLMQTICSTGIRVSELKYITVGAVKARQAIIRCKGKMRVVILPEQLCKMLVQYIKEEKLVKGSVFVTKSGNPLDRSNIWKMLKTLCENAGVSKKKVFPHNFRHLFARTFYSLQKDIVRLADLLGHTSINTTRIYTIESGAEHRKQLQMLGLLQC